MPKVSVIVPVYGVEKYIERCARSLFEQTLDDMEFIFVDDCTPDRSIEVLKNVIEDFPSRRNQVHIIKMPQNSGLHKVRKEGLKNATGDYIAHCDSDDWVELDMYESMYDYAEKNNCDLVKCQIFESDDTTNRPRTLSLRNQNKDQLLSELLYVKGWNFIWDKLAKKQLYSSFEMQWPVTPMWEDFIISSQLLIHSNRFGVIDKHFYHYYKNPTSICNITSINADIRRCMNAKDNLELLIDIFNKQYPSLNYDNELLMLKYEVKRKLIPIMNRYRNYSVWKSVYPEIDLMILSMGLLSKEQIIQYALIVFRLYPIYCLFKKLR